ncbi:glycosyltransferase [Corticibacterium sp. UT-5YL-CI-8]|nr:glycosyltransferase [Tianweitania sp. UT-5YL-CI-8]
MIDATPVAFPGVAVVVIGRNEGQRLIDCLSSLSAYATRAIYVDSGSTDGSSAAARRLGAYVVDLDMRKDFTAARARNAGYRKALKQWPDIAFVQFVDGDCMLDSEWIAAAWRFMALRPDVAAVFGRRRERYPDRSFYNRLCDREWDGKSGSALECGGDVFMRVQAIEHAQGYRTSLIAGEEPELCVRLREAGWMVWRMADEMTLHDADITTMRQWWRRNRRSGHAFAEVSTLHWRSPQGIWKRSLFRAVAWGGALPLIALGGTLIHPAALALLGLYPVQIARIAVRDGLSAEGWRSGFYSILGKFAEFHGVLRWVSNGLTGRRQKIIEYKQVGCKTGG